MTFEWLVTLLRRRLPAQLVQRLPPPANGLARERDIVADWLADSLPADCAGRLEYDTLARLS